MSDRNEKLSRPAVRQLQARRYRSHSRIARRRLLLEGLEHRHLLAAFTVSTVDDSGAGSLRQAILDANLSVGSDVITFNIPGSGVQTIQPLSQLPKITDPVVIDGYTQPGASPNTAATDNNATILIELDGSLITSYADGVILTATAANSTVRGLAINSFTRHGLWITADNTHIAGNFIGTDASGMVMKSNAWGGLQISSASNIVGTDGDGVDDLAERNVISANVWANVWITGTGADHNRVAGNFIGTNAHGTASLGQVVAGLNSYNVGVLVTSASNIIGTNADGTADEAERNIISGAWRHTTRMDDHYGGYGVVLHGKAAIGNVVAGNYMGTDPTGILAVPNSTGGIKTMISGPNRIGTNADGIRDDVERNVISGNKGFGIHEQHSQGVVIAGNYVGTNVDGTAALPNGGGGIDANGTGTVIGGTAPTAGNLVSGNKRYGIYVSSGQGAVVQGNLAGTDVTGTVALPNSYQGIGISGKNHLVGGTQPGARNIASGNAQYGITLFNTTGGNVVQGNFVGTDITGLNPVPNALGGILSGLSRGNTIGGTTAAARNVIAANGGDGIYLWPRLDVTAEYAADNVIQGNYIGIDANGVNTMPNSGHGIRMFRANRNTIGGAAPGAGNVIVGSGLDGILITDVSADNVIQGNMIGVDHHGVARPNGGDGIQVDFYATGTLIGGTAAGEGNVIANNLGDGIYVNGGVTATSWWRAEQTAADAMNRNQGTLEGGASFAPGQYGYGFQLDGVDDYVSVADSSTLDNKLITLDAWIRPDAVDTAQQIISKFGSSGNYAYQLGLAPGGVLRADLSFTQTDTSLNGQTFSSLATLAGAIQPGVWSHVAMVYTTAGGGIWKLYINGEVAASQNGNTAGIYIGGSSPVTIGASAAGGQFFKGLIDEPAVHRVYLTDAKVGDIYQARGASKGGGTTIRGNSILDNGGLGIDLAPDGVTPNDVGDLDTGTNDRQNYPVLSSVSSSASSTVVEGTLSSIAHATYQLDFFANPAADPSGHGEGATYLGSATVQTDGSGVVNFTAVLPVATAVGQFVTATATDVGGNTSEFSGEDDVVPFAPATISGAKFHDLNANGVWDTSTASAVSVSVPGTADPWLAGMPDGSTASLGDVAPDESPVLVPITINPGSTFTFDVTGCVSYGPGGCSGDNPDGVSFGSHTTGAENGISNISAPFNSLIGVFLGPNQPDQAPAPGPLSFDAASRDYVTLAPLLQQTFFIGDGRTSTDQVQQITVPAGATRLFLGTLDGFGWYNNSGAFTVTVNSFPDEPPLANWTIQLDAGADGTVDATTTTDSSGNYAFTGLEPGTYRIREVQQSGWTQTTANPTDILVTTSGQTVTGINFGNHQNSGSGATIGGTKFHDLDGDGSRNGTAVLSQATTVPGTSDMWLAGMPAGSTASSGDVAPTHSPVEVGDLTLAAGISLSFAATGQVGNCGGCEAPTPDGRGMTGHYAGAQNGLSNVVAPVNALLGVFLSDDQPNLTAAPATLDFRTGAGLDYLSLSPELKQVFFIGDGKTSGGVTQEIVVPAGATRLVLGTMDGFGWYNNVGAYNVTISVQDTEPGLAGWTIQLDAGADGSVEYTTTTDAHGNYSFTGLEPGVYRVREVQQPGWRQTSVDPLDMTITVGGQTITGVDFGNQHDPAPATVIRGQKFYDVDGDGSKDGGEPGLAYWWIYLDLDNDGARGSSEPITMTDADGGYRFVDAPLGTYHVRELQRPGWTQTVSPAAVVVTAQGQTFADVDLGNARDGQTMITGQKFFDMDADGIKDIDDPGLYHWPIYLDANHSGTYEPGEPITWTGTDGHYAFVGLAPGSYQVREIERSGWIQKTPDPAPVEITSAGQMVTGVDFGNAREPRTLIAGQKFRDVNADGIKQFDEPGLPYWPIYLDANNNNAYDIGERYTHTGHNGNYSFYDIDPGTYHVREMPRSGWLQTTLDPAAIVVTADGDTFLDVDFGNARDPVTVISGQKFHDINGDGAKQYGEPGLAWWPIYLDINGSGTHEHGEPLTYTHTNGVYSFYGVAPGTYQVREMQRSGWSQTTSNPADIVVSVSGQTFIDVDFGNQRDPRTLITGQKFHDTNGDGIKQLGESGLIYWPIYLDANNSGAYEAGEPRTFTDAGGVYSFHGLDVGTYRVREMQRSGWSQTTVNPAEIVVTQVGQSFFDVDFGNVRDPQTLISGQKFYDINGDGARQTNEQGLHYWPIYIDSNDSGAYEAGEPRTWTDWNGVYSFHGLEPGTYRIREIQLGGWSQTTADPDDVVITAVGQTVSGIDFGNQGSGPIIIGDPPGGPPTDLEVTKNAPRAVAGEQVTYTLRVTNKGPADSYGVILGDQLPAGVIFESVTASQGTCYGGQTVVCAVGSLAVGESATVTIVAHVLSWVQDEIKNEACVYGPAGDLDPSTNCVVIGTPIDRRADLHLTKTAGSQIAIAGEQLTYTLLVRNDGPSDATNVTLRDVLPPEVHFVSADVFPSGSCTIDQNGVTTVLCDLGTIVSGETTQVTLVVRAADWVEDGTLVINHATVSGDHDPNPDNDGSTTYVPCGRASDLELTKTGPFTTVNAEVYYILEVTNHGPSNSSGVIVGDDLPPDINFLSAVPSQGTCNQADPLVCRLGPMVVGQTETVTVYVGVPETVVIENVRNEGIVWGYEGDPNPDNNHGGTGERTDSHIGVVKEAPLQVIAGERMTYTLQVTNEGPDPSSNVIVGDTLPPGVSLVSVTPSQGTCYALNPILCFLGPLAVNQSADVTIVVETPPSLPEGMVLSNTAFAYGGRLPGWDHINTGVRRVADVNVVKTAPEFVVAGTEMTYTLRATNRGPSDATDIVLRDVLPSNLIFKSAAETQGKGSCSAVTVNGETTVSCQIDTLVPGEVATVEIVVLVPSSIAEGTLIHNNVCVTADGFDPNLLDNCYSVGSSVIERSDLQLIKDAPDVVIAGEDILYTLEVYNRGPSDARGVILGDTLPAGVIFVSATATQGTCEYSDGTVLCDVGYVAVGQREFITITAFVPPTTLDGTLIANTGCIVECGHDPNPSNDCSTVYTTVSAKSVLTGVVYNDFDRSASRNVGEPGIAGWQVYIDLNGNNQYDQGERTTYTDAGGVYTFAGLGKGTWYVRQVEDAGWLQTTVNPGGVTTTGQEGTYHGGDFGNKQATLSGRVYIDNNNDGVYQPLDGELGISGVSLSLAGTDDRGMAVHLSVVTDADGAFTFTGLRPGSYEIVEHQPAGYLDGKEKIGTIGGTTAGTIAGNDRFFLNLAKGEDGVDYHCGELEPAKLSGYVYNDTDDDGQIDNGEQAVSGASVVLTGTNDLDEIIHQMVTSDTQGYYEFVDLRPGTYTLHEQQPAGYIDGQDTAGSLGGTVADDQFSNLMLSSGSRGINYNFGEHADVGLHRGQTATIGFWQNPNGQALIQSLNGGAQATNLGDWLATHFANMYGADAGANNLAGKTNEQIAAFYLTLFDQRGQKLDAQVLATAFAVYVTDSDLAGDGATHYGFTVSTGGTGAATFSVGSSGAAFGVDDDTRLTVLQLLKATNVQTVGGKLYNGSAWLRTLANTIYDGINRGGDI